MWCNHTRHTIDLWVDVFWWGVLVRPGKLIWWCSWDVADWRLNLGYIVPEQSLVCPNAGVWLYLWFVGVQKYIPTNAGVIHEGIEGFYFDHRKLHGRVHGSSKIRNSVDNNLLLKIRFRQKSDTYSAVDINRKFWPKRRLHNWYGNTNRGIRKTAVADHLFTEF